MDETATVVAYQEFDPYGNPVAGEGDPYGYTGEWWEDAVGLLHLRARWYAPESGTFLNRDAYEGHILRPQSANGWSYGEGNPILYTDPSGFVISYGAIGSSDKDAMYSCRCGWIDWGYAKLIEKADKYVKKLEDVKNGNTDIVEIEAHGGSVARFRVNATALQGDDALKSVALGLFIATENNVEGRVQANMSWTSWRFSSYSHEDLVSNLIAFHGGIDRMTTKKKIMEICNVVGGASEEDYYYTDKEEYLRIQRIIWEKTLPGVMSARHYTWGTRPNIIWSGKIGIKHKSTSRGTRPCEYLQCKDNSFPNELLSITPASPGQGWVWESFEFYNNYLRGQNYLYNTPIRTKVASSVLNNESLNWKPNSQ